MKRFLISFVILVLLLSGCESAKPVLDEYKKISPVGTVPVEFRSIVENNLFYSADTYIDRVLRYERTENGYLFQMYSLQGDLLAEHSRTADKVTYHINSLIPTEDGGFLYVLGFTDHANPDGTWQSDFGVCSTIVKCDADGNVKWEYPAEDYIGWMLHQCIEGEDAFYFFGEQETPETDRKGVYSPTDVHILKLDKNGTADKNHIIGGSDYDSVEYAQVEDGTFTVYCYAQSGDGDFPESGEWKFTLNENLERLSQEKVQDIPDEAFGIVDGQPVTVDDPMFENLDCGYLTGVLDYGDFILVISENSTGLYENQPGYININWEYTETVYTACDKNGTILWRATIDSSPDYDAMAEAMDKLYKQYTAATGE